MVAAHSQRVNGTLGLTQALTVGRNNLGTLGSKPGNNGMAEVMVVAGLKATCLNERAVCHMPDYGQLGAHLLDRKCASTNGRSAGRSWGTELAERRAATGSVNAARVQLQTIPYPR